MQTKNIDSKSGLSTYPRPQPGICDGSMPLQADGRVHLSETRVPLRIHRPKESIISLFNRLLPFSQFAGLPRCSGGMPMGPDPLRHTPMAWHLLYWRAHPDKTQLQEEQDEQR